MSDRVQTTFLGQNFDFSNLFGIWSGMLKMAQKRLERLFSSNFAPVVLDLGTQGIWGVFVPGYLVGKGEGGVCNWGVCIEVNPFKKRVV